MTASTPPSGHGESASSKIAVESRAPCTPPLFIFSRSLLLLASLRLYSRLVHKTITRLDRLLKVKSPEEIDTVVERTSVTRRDPMRGRELQPTSGLAVPASASAGATAPLCAATLSASPHTRPHKDRSGNKKARSDSSAPSSVQIDLGPSPGRPLPPPVPPPESPERATPAESLPPPSLATHEKQEADVESPLGGLLASWSDRAKQFLSPKGGAPGSAEHVPSQHDNAQLGAPQLTAVAASQNLSA